MNARILFLLLLFLFNANCQGQINQAITTSSISNNLSDYTQSFVSVDFPKLALINAKVIDGTGSAAQKRQTILIANGIIVQIGATNSIKIPEEYHILNLSNRTIIPGIIGTHNHLRLPQGAMFSTAPKLYLAAGVTTIQTCGTGHPAEEIAIANAIKKGELPGCEIINSSPYFTGPDGKSNFIRFTDKKMIRDTIRYWADRGVEWFKVYRNTRPQDLKFILAEAHRQQAKVTGHLCATTFQEAAELGIDAIEHGFIHSYDHAAGKQVDSCSGSPDFRSALSIDSKEVQQVHQALITHGVALTSTLSIFEAQARGIADPRDLAALAPFYIENYKHRLKRRAALGEDWYFKEDWLLKSMQYDLAFFRAGGLLTAGPDPGLHNLPGYGDQKNYELLIEAGFKPVEAIQVMTNNGAKLLNRSDIGSIEKNKRANLVVLHGDLENSASNIRKVEQVFKDGIGYDPARLIAAIEGNVGSETDDQMTYFGQKTPEQTRTLFAPHLVSKPERYEFGSVFSKNGRAFFIGIDKGTQSVILHSILEDGVWSTLAPLLTDEPYSYNDPMLSPDENRLYFISNRPLLEGETKEDFDIWYVERQGSGWSAPIHGGHEINSLSNEYYISFSTDGTMYFASDRDLTSGGQKNFDIYLTEANNGIFQKPVKLPAAINTQAYEADVCIAPDASYLIFCGKRRDGMGKGDLYISFKNENGEWTTAQNMGSQINTIHHELCPFITQDGKYLFYTSNQEIYWISTDILEGMR